MLTFKDEEGFYIAYCPLTKDLKMHGWDVRSKNMKKITAPTLEQLQVSDPTYKSLIDSGTSYNITRTKPSIQQAIA